MIEFDIRSIKQDYEARHFEHIREYLERSLSNHLRNKTEAGCSRSESGYQIVAAQTCASIARALGYDENKAYVLSSAAGVCFPHYGHEGLNAVRQYISNQSIDLDTEHLEFTTSLYFFSHFFFRILKPVTTEPLYELLHDYFYKIDSHPESRIVRLVQETIVDTKKVEAFYEGHPGKLLFDLTQELIDLARNNNRLAKGTILNQHCNDPSSLRLPALAETERQEIFDSLDRRIDTLINHPERLLYPDMTTEEVVVMYILS